MKQLRHSAADRIGATRAARSAVALFAVSLWITVWPAAAQDAQDAQVVGVDKVISEPLSQTVPVIGRLVARQSGIVAARINGPVKEFHVDVGDRVHADQIIATLDRAALRAQRDLRAGAMEEARGDLATSKAELALAQQDLTRLEKLKKSAAFSQARYDDAGQNVAIARAEMHKAESAIATANAELRLYEIYLFDADIRAPYDGVVTQRLTETGAYVMTGDPIVHMISDTSLEIEADVPYERLSGLKKGTRIWASLADGTRHQAVVRSIIPSENPLTRTRAVRFSPRFGDIGKPLADAQTVTVEIPLGSPRQVTTVHKDALVQQPSGPIVYVVEGDSAQARPVELGAAVGSRLEVKSGLREGDLVVIRGNERLQPGVKIRIGGNST